MSLFLTPEELQELTGRKRASAQIRALRAIGVEHKIRPDGHPVVLRAHVEALLGATPGVSSEQYEPNWSMIDDAAA